MARLYANENFPLPVVEELRKQGHDVLTTLDAGRAGQAIGDEEVLSLARTEGRALLTLNRKHFVRLHGLSPEHSGIVVCTFDPDFVGQATRIHGAVSGYRSLSGQLVRVNRPAQPWA
jgi:hypothetical protein